MTRITKLVARSIPLHAEISNALVDFSGMTGSIVALVADSGPTNSPVAGFGFGSIGRYAQTDIIRERMAPRIMEADPEATCDPDGQLDPVRMRQIMLRDEKPGGHGERSVAVGAIDMAAWDLASKLAGVPLYHLLWERLPPTPGWRSMRPVGITVPGTVSAACSANSPVIWKPATPA
jgi:L-alanine-DL-glutamate epimerase-like enolase superfamily enzyme